MPNSAMAAMTAAAAAKKKTKKPSAKSRKVYERAAAAAEKKAVAAEAVAAEAKEGTLGADAVEAALADALGARGAATKARARLGGAGTEEAKAAEARKAGAHHARQAQLAGSVAEVNASPADKVAFAEAELMLTPWEDALEEMRRRERGWVHSREVRGKMAVALLDDPRANHPRVTWYSEGGCGSADMPAKFTAHEAIIMGKAGEEWFTIDDRHLKNGRVPELAM